MTDFNRTPVRRGFDTTRAVSRDEGLRAYMIRVYNYMAMGVALTGIAAWLTFSAAVQTLPTGQLALTSFGRTIYGGPLMILLFFGTLGLVLFVSYRIGRLQPRTALGLFLLYAGLLGVFLSSIFLTYTHGSIARTFFISAASFGALSLYGYTTRRDLTPFRSFLVIGLVGLIIAVVVNMFLKSSGLYFVISAAGVLIFAGLTAWDTQNIRQIYDVNDDGTMSARKEIMGALRLYLDFI
ncbi:MAG TPA: Bax inhibitor-1/YccA family protein, partial [Gammaproteobacteria bacterium]|nr:Bax inhibitor-1/YccA family protein [Gammaproteobacteria bacterium]